MPKYSFNKQGAFINPDVQTEGTNQLAVVSSIQQVEEMSAASISLTLPPTTVATLDEVQSAAYRGHFTQANPRNEGELLEDLSREFNKLELSIGLLEKLRLLQGRHLQFWLDDSGSMAEFSDVPMTEAHPALKKQYDEYLPSLKGRIAQNSKGVLKMTRWAEVQNRLHIIMDLLAYIPTGAISFTFINRLNNTFTLTSEKRRGITPAQFKEEAHKAICKQFDRAPANGTPLGRTMEEAFKNNSVEMVHYLMTDGEPSDCSKKQLEELIVTRGLGYENNDPEKVMRKAKLNPVILISCTDNTAQVEYLKEIDELAPMVAEVDDFNEEKKEVLSKQGNAFPFTKGLWILCQLVAALDPDGLDKLDENKYLPIEFLSLLVGYNLTTESYEYYKQNHPSTPRPAYGSAQQNASSFFPPPPPSNSNQTTSDESSNCVIC